jgi:preprotein translocase subunit SecY
MGIQSFCPKFAYAAVTMTILPRGNMFFCVVYVIVVVIITYNFKAAVRILTTQTEGHKSNMQRKSTKKTETKRTL